MIELLLFFTQTKRRNRLPRTKKETRSGRNMTEKKKNGVREKRKEKETESVLKPLRGIGTRVMKRNTPPLPLLLPPPNLIALVIKRLLLVHHLHHLPVTEDILMERRLLFIGSVVLVTVKTITLRMQSRGYKGTTLVVKTLKRRRREIGPRGKRLLACSPKNSVQYLRKMTSQGTVRHPKRLRK